MSTSLLLKGVIIGLSLAIPVGPIALLCIRRTLARGRLSGLASGLGAATADALFAAVAGFGLTFVSNWLVSHELTLTVIGGSFLCYLGARIFYSVPDPRRPQDEVDGIFSDFLSTFFLTVTNPVTAFCFVAAFAAVGVGIDDDGLLAPILLIVGVFCGSTLWWLILSGSVSYFHRTISLNGLRRVNRISGSIMMLFGLGVLLTVVVKVFG